jgi:hypothetical protein
LVVPDIGIYKDMSCEQVVVGGETPDVDVVDENDAFHILHLVAEMTDVNVFGDPLK